MPYRQVRDSLQNNTPRALSDLFAFQYATDKPDPRKAMFGSRARAHQGS